MRCFSALLLLVTASVDGLAQKPGIRFSDAQPGLDLPWSGQLVTRQYDHYTATSMMLSTTTTTTTAFTSTTTTTTTTTPSLSSSSIPVGYANTSSTLLSSSTSFTFSTLASGSYISTPSATNATSTSSSISTTESSQTITSSVTSETSFASVISKSGFCNASSTAVFTNSVGATEVIILDVTQTVTVGYNVTLAAGTEYGMAYPSSIETTQTACKSSIFAETTERTVGTAISAEPTSLSNMVTGTFFSVTSTSVPDHTAPQPNQVLYITNTVLVTKKTPVVIYSTTPPPPTSPNPVADRSSDMISRVRSTDSSGYSPSGGGSEPNGYNNGDNTGGDGSNTQSAPPGSGQRPDSGTGGGVITQHQAIPTTGTIGNEAVQVQSNSVVIAGSTVAIPSTDQAPSLIVVSSITYTVLPTQIVGPSGTFRFQLNQVPVTTITQPSSVAVINGVTATIGPSQVVISGTTYRAGISANEQTLTVDGKILTINSQGLVSSPTTYTPGITIVVSSSMLYELVAVEGVTMSLDATEAIISGTTYKIGDGVASSTTTISGHVIVIGPSGVVVGTHTITPTSIDQTATMTPSTGLVSTTIGPAETSISSGTETPKKNPAASNLFGHHTVAHTCFMSLALIILLQLCI